MSYREIRNLIEHTRAMGFSRMISVENFTTPNFQLVNELLIWAMKIVDSVFEANNSLETEEDRIFFIRTAAVFFYQKLGIKLNPVRLYGADRLAARELLKVTSSLYNATQKALHLPQDIEEGEFSSESSLANTITGKDLREFRQLASTIVMDAASLHDSLTGEIDFKLRRERTLNQSLDVDRLEATLVSALHSLSAAADEIKESTGKLENQVAEVEEKIQKKNESLVRSHRRLDALNRIKPAWQTEFEQDEAELRETWEEYIIKHKNLSFLESQLEELEEQQQEQLKIATQMYKDAALAANSKSLNSDQECSRTRRRRHFGSMTGENLDSSESESSDSFLNDSASDDDSLTLHSGGESLEKPQPLRKMSPLSKTRENLYDHSLFTDSAYNSHSGNQGLRQTSLTARPKSAHSESRLGSFSGWTGNVKGSERVSPLSASEDNSDGF